MSIWGLLALAANTAIWIYGPEYGLNQADCFQAMIAASLICLCLKEE